MLQKQKFTTRILELRHLVFSFMLISDAILTFKGLLLYRRLRDLVSKDTIVIFCFQPGSFLFSFFEILLFPPRGVEGNKLSNLVLRKLIGLMQETMVSYSDGKMLDKPYKLNLLSSFLMWGSC